MKLPDKFIVDTNIPLTANKILNFQDKDADLLNCIMMCVELIESIVKTKKGLVMDDNGEIFSEYRNKLSLKGQPGIGDRFLRWVHDNRYSFPNEDRVNITPLGDTYEEFPDHPGLNSFDIEDRKFVATANAHPADPKPTIYQGTDSKWWGWKDALLDVGIFVQFPCEEYVKAKYIKKFPSA
jgi:hypothetical protein